jgi:hypothetical protein
MPIKAGERPTRPCAAGPATGLANDAHGFDEVDDLPLVVTDRRGLNVNVLLAARGVVQVEDALRRTRFPCFDLSGQDSPA